MSHNSKLDDGRGVQRHGLPSQKQSHLDLLSSAIVDPGKPRRAINAATTGFIWQVPTVVTVVLTSNVEAVAPASNNHCVSRSDMDWAEGRLAE